MENEIPKKGKFEEKFLECVEVTLLKEQWASFNPKLLQNNF